MAQVFIGYDTYGVNGVNEELIHFIFDMVLAHTASPHHHKLGLIVTTDEHIKALNKRYRGKDESTNVLSFASEVIEELAVPSENDHYLGDVYISYPRVVQEARNLRVSDKERFIQLFAHGALHLLGFDHQEAKDAEVMEQMEDKIVQSVL